jgi:hypothetical protein
MAGAPSPERPVVLRRLGIIKDSNDGFLQESRAPRDTAQDALELFATEAESAPRLERSLTAIRSQALSSIGFIRRNPAVAVIAVSAVSVVIGIWAISRLLGFDASHLQREGAVALAADSSAASASSAASTGASAGAPAKPAPAKPSAAVNAGRTATASVARGQQVARNSVQRATAAVARPVAAPQQLDRDDASAPIATAIEVPAAAPATAPAVAVVDDTIYSAADRDVIPPQTDEKLPGPTISSWTTRMNAMEVIVSQTGAVERVRLVTPPQRMPDMFALSRAKVWTFRPAMKDGRPVRYRLLLTWEVNP